MGFRKETVTLPFIERVVCEHYRIELGYMFKAKGGQRMADIRHQFHYLARKVTSTYLKEIAAYKVDFYNHKKAFNHATIINSERRIESLMFRNPEFTATIALLEQKIINEIERRTLILLKSKHYYRDKIERMMLGFDKCVTTKDFDELLMSHLSQTNLGKVKRIQFSSL